MRAESSTPAIPITRCFGSPERFNATWHIASSGFETMIRMVFGERRTTSSTTFETMPAFVFNRSSRLMPGLRASPAVMITTSELSVSSYVFAPVMRTSKPSTGAASARSKALPCGTPSTISTRTTSPSSLAASQCAAVAPTLPAPTTVIFFRAPISFSSFDLDVRFETGEFTSAYERCQINI